MALANQASSAIRLADLEAADACLAQIAESWPLARRWAVYCNLVALVHEARGQTRLALRWCKRALAADPDYAPGIENIRRLDSERQFGSASQCVVIGDEPDDVMQFRMPVAGARQRR